MSDFYVAIGDTTTAERLGAGEETELWLGPGPDGSVFGSRAELEAAWIAGRARLMALYGSAGRRPLASRTKMFSRRLARSRATSLSVA